MDYYQKKKKSTIYEIIYNLKKLSFIYPKNILLLYNKIKKI